MREKEGPFQTTRTFPNGEELPESVVVEENCIKINTNSNCEKPNSTLQRDSRQIKVKYCKARSANAFHTQPNPETLYALKGEIGRDGYQR